MTGQIQAMHDRGLAPEGGEVGVFQSGWRLALRDFAKNRRAVIGVAILVFVVAFCFIGPWVYRTDQITPNLAGAYEPPSPAHPLGTDSHGFDELGRIMKGGQTALQISFLAAFIATTVGTLWGMVSGLLGGIIDSIMMRVVDVFLSVPVVFVVLILSVKFGASVLSLSLVIGAFSWLFSARLIRSEVLSLRSMDFVLAARGAGSGNWRLIFRHLLPNSLGVIIVSVTLQVAESILLVSYVGFLGFGLHYPSVDWGNQLSDGIQDVQNGYWWLVFPVATCIVLTVMALNLVGDALRDSFDVRLRRR
ncbi:ABC transporter permease [Nonomuraea sp. B1E8]|uniref:ABC transporter permease n=1 Tax=unclassified Nonomuraea TaxID=2593643 RepID=UPI00325D1222